MAKRDDTRDTPTPVVNGQAGTVLNIVPLPGNKAALAIDSVARLVAAASWLPPAGTHPRVHHSSMPRHHHRLIHRRISAAKKETSSISGHAGARRFFVLLNNRAT